MKMTVIVPTYRRPKDLARCLEALKKQSRPVDELLVVVRDTDTETWAFLGTFKPETLALRTLTVTEPGAIAAMNVGLDAATGDIISFTDDDAAPRPDWLACIESHFLSDNRIGGVGGRDWLYRGSRLQEATIHPGASDLVGRVQWFGRVIGNHHLGDGKAREVDVLKGVNMSFRRSAIINRHFDRHMRGTSSQIHFEIEFCLALRRAGWKLIYDPEIAVDHYLGQRFDEDKRDEFNELATINIAHNMTLALLKHLSPPQKIMFIIWAILVGTRSEPGFLQYLKLIQMKREFATKRFLAALNGRWAGLQTWRQQSF